jgi:hypothetical protein
MMNEYHRAEHDVFERENDIILDYMVSFLQDMCRKPETISNENLYQFHKYLDAIDTDCWAYAIISI